LPKRRTNEHSQTAYKLDNLRRIPRLQVRRKGLAQTAENNAPLEMDCKEGETMTLDVSEPRPAAEWVHLFDLTLFELISLLEAKFAAANQTAKLSAELVGRMNNEQ
jgi:hypothetical protein